MIACRKKSELSDITLSSKSPKPNPEKEKEKKTDALANIDINNYASKCTVLKSIMELVYKLPY